MSGRRWFGTDGIRGRVGGEAINESFFFRLGQAWGRFLEEKSGGGSGVLLARDTRGSGIGLEAAFCAGLEKVGGKAETLGVVPTPVLCWQMTHRGKEGAVMLTASHNPSSDNGIKFFRPPGRKLRDSEEEALEAFLAEAAVPEGNLKEGWGAGEAEAKETWMGDWEAYAEAVAKNFAELDLSGRKVVLDTANGATWAVAPALLRKRGAELVLMGGSPDGQNINAETGSEFPGKLAERVVREGADWGIAHDGDGDRVVLVDETGAVIDGDQILYLLATDDVARGDLPKNTVVTTVQSNLGLDLSLGRRGVKVKRVSVGDRHVSEAMQAEGLRWGGESSGHVICGDYQWTGDGMVAALAVLRVLERRGEPLSVAVRELQRVPQVTSKREVPAKPPLEELRNLSGVIQEAEESLAGQGRVMVRYSGTEPVMRFLVEAPTQELAMEWRQRLETALEEDWKGS